MIETAALFPREPSSAVFCRHRCATGAEMKKGPLPTRSQLPARQMLLIGHNGLAVVIEEGGAYAVAGD